ncbi:TIGR04076 family protein [Chloroflexota bacterium]
MASSVKITVIKKVNTNDLYENKLPCKIADWQERECPLFNVGDEYVVKEDGFCPQGFCGWAFADIQRDVVHMLFEGSYPWIEDKGVCISCCTDGLRPVFFKLEKQD